MASTVDHTTPLGDLVSAHPGLARDLERMGLDYCCGGQRQLGDACVDAGLDVATVVADLRSSAGTEAPPKWAGLGPSEMVDHLEAVHHAYLREELPRLTALAEKVTSVHGDRHSELAGVKTSLAALRADLEPHLDREEQVLFPMIRRLSAAEEPQSFPCGSIENPISVMLRDHDRAGELLARLSELTSGYSVPDDGCASYQAFYDGLAELEADTHLHVHKENNLLFPAVLVLEQDLR